MSRSIRCRVRLLLVLLGVFDQATATEIVNRFTTTTSAVENRCFATTPSRNGDDCSANASDPLGLGKVQWIGPVFGAGYYAPGAGSQYFARRAGSDSTTALHLEPPLDGTTGISVSGLIAISDAGTPSDPTDDLCGGSLQFGAYDRIFDFGDGTFGLERDRPSLHGLGTRRVTSATRNAAGGYDYLVGRGIPVLAAATATKGDQSVAFPSAVASRSTKNPDDKPFWAAPAAVGIATFEGNTGGSTRAETTPTGYSCLTDMGGGPVACPDGPGVHGGPAYVFQNILMTISTDAKGRITAGQMLLVQERKVLPDSSKNDSWQALTLSFSGILDARPVAVDDIVPLKGNKPLTIKVLANDTGLADKPLTVLIAVKPTRGTATVNTDNTITYAPNSGTTSDRLKYRVTDRNGDTSIGKVIIGSNSQPVANDDVVNLDVLRFAKPEGTLRLLIPYLANDTGIDDTPITVRIIGEPAHGSAAVEPQSQQMYYVPGSGFSGSDTFRYQLQDVDDDKSTAAVNVRGLFARPDAATESSGAPIKVEVLANDVGRTDTPIRITISRQPAHGTAAVNGDNSVTYISATGFSGAFLPSLRCPTGDQCGDSFDYTITDAEGDTATATVFVNVLPPAESGNKR